MLPVAAYEDLLPKPLEEVRRILGVPGLQVPPRGRRGRDPRRRQLLVRIDPTRGDRPPGVYTRGVLSPAIRHLRDYVAIPSVNPGRRTDIPAEIAGERRYAIHVNEQLRRLGLDSELIGAPERPSVIATATASGASETILIASHLDTVPVDGMEIDPFDPCIEGDQLFGRGSCDTKGGLAALVAALEVLLPAGRLKRNLIVVGEADEEVGSQGIRDVVDHLAGKQPLWALATEPTEMRVVTHHKGVGFLRLTATGVACHSSNPTAGRNAIIAIARAVIALEKLGARLAERHHDRLGSPSLSVGMIGGGLAANIVPDHAWLQTDRRALPGETEAQIVAEVEEALRSGGADDVVVESCSIEKPALATPDESVSVRACRAALASLSLPDEPASLAFGTDAAILAEHGIPSVVLGPGAVAQAHTTREHVSIRQVDLATDLFVKLLSD